MAPTTAIPGAQTGWVLSEDGTPLAWTAVGDGPPLVCNNGVGVSTFFWNYLVDHVRDRFRVVVWDYPGHGQSPAPAGSPERSDLSIPRLARDLSRVRAAAGATGPAVLVGHSMGVQVILQAWLQDRSTVRALVPMFGTAGRPLDTFLAGPMSRRAFQWLAGASDRAGPRAAAVVRAATSAPLAIRLGRSTGMVDRYYARDEDIVNYLRHFETLDPRVFLRMVLQMADHDLRPSLDQIDVPTLVFGAENDRFTPLACSRDMHRRIPEAELMILPEASHAALVEQTEIIHRRLDRFFRERLGVTG